MHRLQKTALICLLMGLLLLLPLSASASTPGSAADPLISQSWLDEYLDAKFTPLEQRLEQLTADIRQYLGIGSVDMQLFIGKNTAYVNGLEKKIDPDRSQVVPELKSDAGGGGYTMVPIRFIAENMGVEVEWNASSRQVILTEGNRRISLTIGSREASVNNSAYTMGYAPYISGERTFVHIRFVAEALSCQVDWDQAQKRVDIKR